MKYTRLPALSGKALIELLQKDNWTPKRRTRHGISMVKRIEDRNVVTVIPDTNASLPAWTLQAILGPKQTGLGKKGLLKLLNRYGI